MHDRLGLRLRIALFFAGLALGGIAALILGLWFGASRYGASLDGYVIAGIVGGLGIAGLAAWIGLLFDENVARPILALAGDLHTRAAADIGSKQIDEAPARYLGALAPAANAINEALAEARTAQARAVAAETEQLQREKRLFEALVRDLAEGVVVTTRDGRVMLFNRAAQGLLDGLGLDRRLSSLIRPEPLMQALDRLALRRARGEAGPETFLAATASGEGFLLGQISPIHGAEMPEGHVIILRDATTDLKAHADRDDLINALMEGVRRPASAIGATLEVLRSAPDLDAETRASFTAAEIEELDRLTACLRDIEARYEAVTTRAWPMVELAASDLMDAVAARSGGLVTARPGDDWLRCDPFAMAALLGNLARRLVEERHRQHLELHAELHGQELWLSLSWTGTPVLDGALQNWLSEPLSQGYGRYTGRDALAAHRTDIWASGILDRPKLVLPLPATVAASRQPPAPWSDFYDFDLPSGIDAGDLADMPLDRLSYVVFDTETTGLSPRDGDRIVQIAGVRIVNGKVRRAEVFDTLVDPERAIPAASTLVHRITDEMVDQAETIAPVGRRFHDFCEGAVLVAHNAPFDMAFLKAQETRIGRRFDHPVLCTVLLSAALFDSSADHSLDGLCARLGVTIPEDARHTALGDALATAEVFASLIQMLDQAGIHTLQQAIEAGNRQTRLRRAQSY
ncbi:exonuclease domain-containing protein [Marinibacterium profundimaris]|uniref:DNA-directed DNA polymerase n=1 Tax=Marinibacterium profundimaris TaxID=1679460 RepID=A0A225NNY1_9RHOB|nr:exonuclease domain-containing protein [Marinibacterium profundimaris]OWU76062.1 exonuclease [Marinibacterium profundimaris]